MKANLTQSTQPEDRPNEEKSDIFILRLYVAGQTPKSMTAFANLKRICEDYLTGRYQLEVVDLLENPQPDAFDKARERSSRIRRPG